MTTLVVQRLLQARSTWARAVSSRCSRTSGVTGCHSGERLERAES